VWRCCCSLAIYTCVAKLGLMLDAGRRLRDAGCGQRAGLALAALWDGLRLWPGVTLGALSPQSLVARRWSGVGKSPAATRFEAVLAAYALRRLLHVEGGFDRVVQVVGW